MNTFLPYPDFEASARSLDDKRLGKQRVEVLQILNVLTIPERKGWRNHPCTLMWKGHEAALCDYGLAVCREWTRRGYRDTVFDKISALRERVSGSDPAWLGDPNLHASHRSNLLRKDEAYYRKHGWTEPADLEYVWPAPNRL